jgi:hypothetical protein
MGEKSKRNSERPELAGSGSCPYSPKADLRKQRDFSTVRLHAQRPIHTLGHKATVTVTFHCWHELLRQPVNLLLLA